MKLNIILFVTLIVLVGIVDIANAEKRLRFTIKNITTWSDNNYCNFSYIIDEKIPNAELILKILTPVNDMDFYIQGNAVVKNNKRYYASINASYSLCQVLSLKNASPIAMLVFAHLKSYGHIIDSCPIKKDTYNLKKIWPEDHSAQLKLPELDFDVNMKAYAVQNDDPMLIMDTYMAAEAIYMDVAGDMKKTGLLSLLNGR